MIIIDVTSSGSIEKALKELKRKFDRTGMKKELRKRKEFEKPSIKKRNQKRHAIHVEKKFKKDGIS